MKKSEETRKKLLEVAIRLIWESNYDNVGVNEICKVAEVTKGGFYYHFETKADLFYESSLYYWSQAKKEYDEMYSPSYTPLEQLENLISFMIEKQQSDEKCAVRGCPFVTSGALCGCKNEKIRKASREISDNIIKYNMALVRNLKSENLLNGKPDALQTGRILHEFIQGVLLIGTVYNDLDIVKTDLREGVYQIVNLKDEYRK